MFAKRFNRKRLSSGGKRAGRASFGRLKKALLVCIASYDELPITDPKLVSSLLPMLPWLRVYDCSVIKFFTA